jgi:hypothetical protein
MKKILTIVSILSVISLQAQLPDHIYQHNIHTVKLYKYGDILSYPILSLGSNEQLELHFDDLEGDVKNYYYSFVLCNADWTPANVQSFDYIRGFQTNRITNYRTSNMSATRYTHYQVVFPERNSTPVKSGNYLLKVFLNDDTSRLAFTKRFLVVNNKIVVAAQVTQPYNGNYFQTHQRIQVAVNTANAQISTFSPQDLKIVVMQNNIWSTAGLLDRPTVYRGNYYEYNDDDNTTFPAGREWRWIDLRSLRLMSDRMTKLIDNDSTKRIDVYVKPDDDRSQKIYVYYNDLDGNFTIENQDGNNPYWQSDYAWTHFTLIPPGNRAFEGKSVYIFGELTNYEQNDASRMIFNDEKGVYEKELLLKQGYYNYAYVAMPDRVQRGSKPVLEFTEGNYWGTENNYKVMVYFRPFGARSDELIGFANINSVFQR